MRVKKPTSKRMTTRLREGIKKKAAAQRRKDKKIAKKDVTWKSRQKKDPGIPSSFPYKEQLIQEIEQRKKEREEQKLLMKQQRQNAQLKQNSNNGENDDDVMEDDNLDDNRANDMAALLESAENAAKEFNGESNNNNNEDNDKMDEEFEVIDYEIPIDEEIEESNNSEIEKSRKQFDKIFKSVVDSSDVILYVLDARDPDNTRSKKIEEAILQTQGKRLILLLNKVDLVPDEIVKQWLDFLGSSFPTIPIKASNGANNSKSFNKKLTQNQTANQLLLALKAYAQKSNLHRAITVGVIGYPNVGKSSIINALTSQHQHINKTNSKVCPVGNQAGITRTLREIKIDNKLKIIDSPGIVFPDNKSKNNKKEYEAKLAILSAIPEKQIEDPIYAVRYLLNKLSKDNLMAENFKEFYKIPAIASINLDDFTKKVLIHIARNQGRLGRGGIPNLHAASMIVLKDWRDGKFQGWTLPKSSNKFNNQEDNNKEKNKIPNGASGALPPPKVEQTTIVKEWSKEFDLDTLFADVFGN